MHWCLNTHIESAQWFQFRLLHWFVILDEPHTHTHPCEVLSVHCTPMIVPFPTLAKYLYSCTLSLFLSPDSDIRFSLETLSCLPVFWAVSVIISVFGFWLKFSWPACFWFLLPRYWIVDTIVDSIFKDTLLCTNIQLKSIDLSYFFIFLFI